MPSDRSLPVPAISDLDQRDPSLLLQERDPYYRFHQGKYTERATPSLQNPSLQNPSLQDLSERDPSLLLEERDPYYKFHQGKYTERAKDTSIIGSWLEKHRGSLEPEDTQGLDRFTKGARRVVGKVASNVLGTPRVLENLLNALPRIPGLHKPKNPEGDKTFFPSSDAIKGLAPQMFSEKEEGLPGFLEDVAETAGTIASFGGLGSIGKTLAGSLLSETGRSTAKQLNAPLWVQEAASMAPLVITGMLRPSGAKKFADSLMESAYKGLESIPGDLSPSTLSNLKQAASKAYNAKSLTKPVQSGLSKIKKDLITSRTPEDLITIRRALNDTYPTLSKQASGKNAHRQFIKLVDDALESFAKTSPESSAWHKAYREAVDVQRLFHKTADSQNFLLRNIKKLKNYPGATMIAHALHLFPKATSLAGVGLAGAKGLINAKTVFSRMRQSPAMRKYYADAMSAFLKENTPALINSLHKIDKELTQKPHYPQV